jgi:hypothetical protein
MIARLHGGICDPRFDQRRAAKKNLIKTGRWIPPIGWNRDP